MAKKRIVSVDLGWIILEQLKEECFPHGMSLAVVLDENRAAGARLSMQEAASV